MVIMLIPCQLRYTVTREQIVNMRHGCDNNERVAPVGVCGKIVIPPGDQVLDPGLFADLLQRCLSCLRQTSKMTCIMHHVVTEQYRILLGFGFFINL